MNTDKRLIVAIDVDTMEKVQQLVETLGESVSYYKVGMELFYSIGREVITYLNEQGKDVFLDLKLHDIPNTVGKSLAALTGMAGITMLNVHASGGPEMMVAGALSVRNKAIAMGIEPPKLIGVTVLTSINDREWTALGYHGDLSAQVVHLALLAQKSGLDGVVASPQEAVKIRQACGENFIIVTPGIRPRGAAINDQSRIATPASALENGAHHLVIGRPITAAENPREAAHAILEEMRGI